ncbi:uncharacterized protein LOC118491405 [Helianthus annuus]|uniref:uncharacterized protein LOC118491405 n=1 Tax=Helianthus annuus TaxID=4232 RepID=UPI0016532177|nr:uncharacterized protein LOC118491405 [Helianthus annuus]
MEQKLPAITKKVCNLVRAIFFTLNKDISRRKFLVNLNMMMKQGKMAQKSPSGEYENKHQNNCHRLSNANPPLAMDDCDDITIDPTVLKVLNTMISPLVSPPLPGFMESPIVEDGQVDEAAEKFIRRFYYDLRQENI